MYTWCDKVYEIIHTTELCTIYCDAGFLGVLTEKNL